MGSSAEDTNFPLGHPTPPKSVGSNGGKRIQKTFPYFYRPMRVWHERKPDGTYHKSCLHESKSNQIVLFFFFQQKYNKEDSTCTRPLTPCPNNNEMWETNMAHENPSSSCFCFLLSSDSFHFP